MKTVVSLALAGATLAFAPSAMASEASPFAGAYAGVNTTSATLDTEHSDLDYWYNDAQNYGIDDSNIMFGLKAGYDVVKGPVIVGVLGEVSFGKISSYTETHPDDPEYALGSTIKTLGSLRAKIGLTEGKLAVFATGGLALSDAKHDYFETDGTAEYFNNKGKRTGHVFGLGASYAVTDKVSVGIDLSRYSFGSRTHTLNAGENEFEDYYDVDEAPRFKLKDKVETVSVGMNFHF